MLFKDHFGSATHLSGALRADVGIYDLNPPTEQFAGFVRVWWYWPTIRTLQRPTPVDVVSFNVHEELEVFQAVVL